MNKKHFLVSFYFDLNFPELVSEDAFDEEVFCKLSSELHDFVYSGLQVEWVSSVGLNERISFVVECNASSLSMLEPFKHAFLGETKKVDGVFAIDCVGIISFELDTKQLNCGLCAHCGCWVSDREVALPKPISELSIGAVYQGQLLCDVCLPSNHSWAF